MDFLRALITAPVSIAVLFLLSKFIGNKQMSSLNLFDYINGITIGSIAAEMATAEMSDFWACFAALIVYVFCRLNNILCILQVSSKFLEQKRSSSKQRLIAIVSSTHDIISINEMFSGCFASI